MGGISPLSALSLQMSLEHGIFTPKGSNLMCCCGKPTINGEHGFRWQPNDLPGVYPVMAPKIVDGDQILFDEPGRCGSGDSHSHHYRLVKNNGRIYLVVAHGAGEERVKLSPSASKEFLHGFEQMHPEFRYWTMGVIFSAHWEAAREARAAEAQKWREAAATKRIKTRKQRGSGAVKVWIESAVLPGVPAEGVTV